VRRAPKRAPAATPRRWILLIHRLPPRPLYLRAKIRHRLAAAGAVALKRSVYALPFAEEHRLALREIRDEAAGSGGEAHVCAVRFDEPATDDELVEASRRDRAADWKALAEEARRALDGDPSRRAGILARGRRRFDEIARIDFFQAGGRAGAEKLLRELERSARTAPEGPRPGAPAGSAAGHPSGATWTTRRGVQVDRIASAWLIRRFVDPRGRFRFVDPADPRRDDEVRFDMPDGDFSHEGDRCTFETLLARSGLRDRALHSVAEIVHDIDLKDGKFGRPEARGVERVLIGIQLATRDDEERLERGFALFDGLYRSFQAAAPEEVER